MEIGQHEILFAQKLSCGEPGIRKKAFNRLEKWLKSRVVKQQPFTREDFLKLWKGLYYCLWLQDKPLNQEDLTDNITKLLDVFTNEEQKLLFIETFFEEMAKDWHSIDQWRMDKFMMLFRRFFRRILVWLKENKWNSDLLANVFAIFRQTVWNPCPESYPEGLKIHFVSFYLDEFDNAAAGEFSTDKTYQFLEPYIDLLNEKTISDIFFDSVLSDIFKLLLEYSADLLEKEAKNKNKTDPFLEFDMNRIKSALFDAGKSKSTPRRRRGQIYAYVKKFDLIITGYDPFYEEVSSKEELNESDIDNAAEKLVKMSSLTQKRKKSDEDEQLSDMSDEETVNFIESKKKKKFNNRKKQGKFISRDKLKKKKSSKSKSNKFVYL